MGGTGVRSAFTFLVDAHFPVSFRRFSVQRCARCHLGISASEMVMRARESVYHLSCFTCTTCNKTLTTGDHFGMKDNLVYCRAHFESLLQGEYPPQLSYTELAAKSGGLALPYFNGTGTVQKGRPRKRKSPALGVDIVNYNSGGKHTLNLPPAPPKRAFSGCPSARQCIAQPGRILLNHWKIKQTAL